MRTDHDAGAPQPDGFEDPVRERAETDAIEGHPDVSVATDPGEHGVHLDDKADPERDHEELYEEAAVSFATDAGEIVRNREPDDEGAHGSQERNADGPHNKPGH